jgi:hypothetical protein
MSMRIRKFATMFYQHLAVVLLCASLITATIPLTSCTTSQQLNVVTDIQKFLPAITNIATVVCSYALTSPICANSNGITSITSSAAILDQALINYYTAKANGTIPPGIVAALQEAITIFESNAGAILDAVHVLSPSTQMEVEGIVAAASILLAVVEGLLPSAVSATKFSAAKPANASNFDISVWVGDYNSKVSVVEKVLPRNVTLKKIHVHNLFMRLVTAGILK